MFLSASLSLPLPLALQSINVIFKNKAHVLLISKPSFPYSQTTLRAASRFSCCFSLAGKCLLCPDLPTAGFGSCIFSYRKRQGDWVTSRRSLGDGGFQHLLLDPPFSTPGFAAGAVLPSLLGSEWWGWGVRNSSMRSSFSPEDIL